MRPDVTVYDVTFTTIIASRSDGYRKSCPEATVFEDKCLPKEERAALVDEFEKELEEEMEKELGRWKGWWE